MPNIVDRHNWFKWILLGLLIINIGLGVVLYFRPDDLEHIYFFDVGQGDASLIKTSENRYILIDGGPDERIIPALDSVMPMWHRQLDLVILTHPHSDHATGLLKVLDRYQVKEFWYTGTTYDSETYKTLVAKITASKIPIQLANQGDNYLTGNTHLRVVFPPNEQPTANDPNETSVVSLLQYQNFEVLFTGDASVGNETSYATQLPDVDVIKVPHHGSKTASSQLLLSQSRPEIGVISVGAQNSFGHPSPETLARYESAGTKLYRTDTNRTIEIITDGQRYRIRAS
ncbi:MAG: ComEC/Rec2 family competence protein [Patescibacteria group bacterium]|jgi:competence protein ComEC